ncbi:MAG: hypothetical protein HOY79_47380 [Streptomyces sp.]|nr:hypothetical protein [Streptomyces sp.]
MTTSAPDGPEDDRARTDFHHAHTVDNAPRQVIGHEEDIEGDTRRNLGQLLAAPKPSKTWSRPPADSNPR